MVQKSFSPSGAFSVFWVWPRSEWCYAQFSPDSKRFLSGLSNEVLFVSEFISKGDQRRQKFQVKTKGCQNLRPKCVQARSAQVRLSLGSNHFQTLLNGNFAALWHTDPKFSALKDLNSSLSLSKVQDSSRILRLGFALSKRPHLHRVDLATVCKRGVTTVSSLNWLK